jgi:hypothetical protein
MHDGPVAVAQGIHTAISTRHPLDAQRWPETAYAEAAHGRVASKEVRPNVE